MFRWSILHCLVLLAALGAAANVDSVVAQPPSDIPEVDGAPSAPLPPLPESFRQERHGQVDWAFPTDAASQARDLQQAFENASRRARRPFGLQTLGALTIRLAGNHRELAALAPEAAPPPAYAVGVAYPRRRLILISLEPPNSWSYPRLDRVLVHELAHLALHQATDGAPLPRWFVEGLAVHQAQENDLARVRVLASAAFTDDLLPLDSLSRQFPSAPHRVNVAYAQSADMVGYMMSQDDGVPFAKLLSALRKDVGFDEAVTRAFHMPPSQLMGRWQVEALERFRTFPLFISGSLIWLVGAVLLFLAYLKRRRQHRSGVARLAEAEAAETSGGMVVRIISKGGDSAGDSGQSRGAEPPWVQTLPSPAEAEIPTVEYEGKNHTLH